MQNAFRSLSGWRISPESDVAPRWARPNLYSVSSPFSPVVSRLRNCGPPKHSGVVSEVHDRKDESSSSGTTAKIPRVFLNAMLAVTWIIF
jgi:hypothetical protein